MRTAYLEDRSIAALARDHGGQGIPAVPAQRKARREDKNRITMLTPTRP
ncbi:hypothetical protein GCM10010387_65680 [Streptomyces inusitatus]|uniref:Uncharacterized protein n=1 Tax=Streptomyces inusitatus TaxID=68221 RepID=A0A918QRR8_9ACTN|nr:hypothetical protein [Streptomyces inusitatus]GGZ63133.1 hypothetical protein GCM10010387_65680 [Streptomyces inusitatus]